MLDFTSFTILAVVLSIGILIQASSGFAAGLLAVPVLLLSGAFAVPEAQAAILVSTTPQNLFGVWSFRQEIHWRDLLFPAILRLTGLPIGALILYQAEALPREAIHQGVGAGVVAIAVAMLILRPTPRASVSQAYSIPAFFFSGVMQGLIGMGGPLMVFWVQAHDWSTKRSRGFLFSMYLISLVPAYLTLYLVFGNRIFPPMLTTVVLVPWLLVVTWFGLKLGTKLGRIRLRYFTLALLILLGLVAVFSPYLR
ncbi:MAG: sulfite exporter TauE/SafE family protein [Planctomycetaceae bacterium]|nr:sulfite exporter TauE/SafE family protein [Planctomycetaceae bacterium]